MQVMSHGGEGRGRTLSGLQERSYGWGDGNWRVQTCSLVSILVKILVGGVCRYLMGQLWKLQSRQEYLAVCWGGGRALLGEWPAPPGRGHDKVKMMVRLGCAERP